MRFLIAVILVLIGVICSIPPPPDHPIRDICAAYKQKCIIKLNRDDCDVRTMECEKYAKQGVNTTWNFCMFSNNYDLSICRARSDIDFQIIKDWISKDQFKYLPE